MNSYFITLPTAYNNSPTTGPGCIPDGGSLSCPRGILLGDSDTGSAELDTSKVFAWDRKVNISFTLHKRTKVGQVNLFFYNIPSSGIGLPPAKFFWGNTSPISQYNWNPLSHIIVGRPVLASVTVPT